MINGNGVAPGMCGRHHCHKKIRKRQQQLIDMYRRRFKMIRQTLKVLAILGVVLHLAVVAEKAKEANADRSINRKHLMSEQFIHSLSVTKGSERRVLQLQNIETITPRSADETAERSHKMLVLSRRMQKQRTMQRRKGRFPGRQRRVRKPGALNGGRGGARNGKWSSSGWNGGGRRGRTGRRKPRGWNGGGRNRQDGKSNKKPTSTSWEAQRNRSWGSPWGKRVRKPGYSPTKPHPKTYYPTYFESSKPTPKPQTPTPKPTTPDMREVQVTMNGVLTAINVDVPEEGSQDIKTLAEVFRRTIQVFLGEEYDVEVYEIGGVPVPVNDDSIESDDEEETADPTQESSPPPTVNPTGEEEDEEEEDKKESKRKKRKEPTRNLQAGSGNEQSWVEWDTNIWDKNEETNWDQCPVDDGQVPVLFELKVIRRCYNCNEDKAFELGAKTFSETFAVLEEAVRSGDMSRAFCMNALRARVVSYPCDVSITCVKGLFFYDLFVDEIVETTQPTPSDTYEPTTIPTYEPTPNEPTVEPTPTATTPEPTPAVTDEEPTLEPTPPLTDDEPTPEPTPAVTFEDPTLEPTTLEPTPAPTLEPTTLEPTPLQLDPTPGPTFIDEPTLEPFIDEPTLEPTFIDEPTLEPTFIDEPTPEPFVDEPTLAPILGQPTLIPTELVTRDPTLIPTAFDDSPTFQPSFTDSTPLFIIGSSESVGNTEIFDYEVPFNVGEDVIFASAGSEYTLVILDDESAAVAGFIENIIDYSGYFGLPSEDLLEGSNELAVIDSVVNLDGDLRSAPSFRRVQAGVRTNDGMMHSAFIDVNGNVYAAGSNNSGQLCLGDLDDRDIPHQIDLGEAAVSVAVGGEFTLILGASGDVYGCGSNEFGQLGLGSALFVDLPDNGNGLRNVKSISAGLEHSLLSTEGGLVVMGSNSEQQLCTDEFDEVDEPYFLDAIGSDDARQFRAGSQSTYILFRDGSVAACGLNAFGQLGIGEFDDPGPATVTIPGNNFIKTLGVGPSAVSAFFVALDGVVYGAGRNNRGQLGLGDRDDRDSPEQVLFEIDADDVTRISAGSDHTLAW